MKSSFLPLVLFLIPGAALAQVEVPAGTVLPVTLHGSLSTTKSKPGDLIKARVMQDIPLGAGSKIRAGAYVDGKVISVATASGGNSARITFQFNRLITSKGATSITTNLRALASTLEVTSAQMPMYDDHGSSSYVNNTRQIGGETVYRGGGHVMDGHMVVGEPLNDIDVVGRVRANPDRDFRGAIDGNDRPQALWLFSTDACGVYGYRRLKIEHAGRTNPIGEITISAERGEIHIRGGAAMLLRVNSKSEADGT